MAADAAVANLSHISIVAQKYAKAAFNVACESNMLEQFSQGLASLSDAFSLKLMKEISNPAISKKDLTLVAKDLSEKIKAGAELSKFIETVFVARKASLLPQINAAFLVLLQEKNDILVAEICSANLLDKDDLEEIKKFLQKKFSAKEISLKQEIKKDLIAGFTIQVGSVMIDASIKTKLAHLKQELLSF